MLPDVPDRHCVLCGVSLPDYFLSSLGPVCLSPIACYDRREALMYGPSITLPNTNDNGTEVYSQNRSKASGGQRA